ncbi:pyrophosphatase [Candidatus Roizmanbacteria bacterium]|nr:pyrophosphatase [Candidatus Roizmanbacteria bacterium]
MTIQELAEQIEKVSQKYVSVYHIERNKDWYILKLQEELGELIQAYLMFEGQGRSKGKTKSEMKDDLDKEVADVFCHLLLLAKNYNVNLEKAIQDKWLKWNEV